MSSGVACSDDCVTQYNALKLGHAFRYVIYKISDDAKSINVETTAPPDATFDDFLRSLPADDCRFCVFDYAFTVDGGQRNKIVFVYWVPDTSRVKSKMLYASSKDALKKKLVGISFEVQATDVSEVTSEIVLEKCLKFSN